MTVCTRQSLLGISLLALVAAGSWSCAPTAPGDDEASLTIESRAIMGGYFDNIDTSVVGFVAIGGGGLGVCSGTLISPNAVLTAHHCVAPTINQVNGGVSCGVTAFGMTYAPYMLHITTDMELTQNPSRYYSGAQVLIPPGSGFCGRDVALLILEEPVPESETVALTPRVDEELLSETPWIPGSGEIYSAIGYGNTSDDGGGSGIRRRRDDLMVTCVGSQCPSYAVMPEEWVGDQGICEGDSGGPAVDTVGRVVGVASRGGPGCSSPVYGSVYAWGDWLKEQVVTAANDAGFEPPAWATGWATHPDYAFEVGLTCGGDHQCDSGICVGGYCTRRCKDTAPCPEPFTCNPDSLVCVVAPLGQLCETAVDCAGAPCSDGYCTRACGDDIPCEEPYRCDADSGLCKLVEIGGPCTQNTHCDSSVCYNELCTRECSDDAPCFEPWTCSESGVCELMEVGLACSGSAECESGMCINGACTRHCVEPLVPCPRGYQCADGACQLIPLGEACSDTEPCGAGTCHEGLCTRQCHELAPCLDGYVCDPDLHMCVLVGVGGGCAEEGDCPDGTCVNGMCTRGCSNQAPCPTGYRCEMGQCAIDPNNPPIIGGGSSTGCSGAGDSGPPAPLLLALLLVALAAGRRRA